MKMFIRRFLFINIMKRKMLGQGAHILRDGRHSLFRRYAGSQFNAGIRHDPLLLIALNITQVEENGIEHALDRTAELIIHRQTAVSRIKDAVEGEGAAVVQIAVQQGVVRRIGKLGGIVDDQLFSRAPGTMLP